MMTFKTQPSKYVESEVESSSISTTGIPLLLQMSAAQFLIKFDILRHLSFLANY
jgi:hypothetical protein